MDCIRKLLLGLACLHVFAPSLSLTGDDRSVARYKARKRELARTVPLWRSSRYQAACSGFRKLGEKDNPVAYYFYSYGISRNILSIQAGRTGREPVEGRFSRSLKVAEAGDELSQYVLGRMYSYGEGTGKDVREGIK